MWQRLQNQYRVRYCGFFRRLIATSQPKDVLEVVERYDKEREGIEASLMDLILVSGGVTTWTELMTMPLPSIKIMTERLNKRTEEQNQARQKAQAQRRAR